MTPGDLSAGVGVEVGATPGSSGLTCRAPELAMHFSLAGHVHACCQNGAYSFGDIAETPLIDIWRGLLRRTMATDLADGRYPVGCELCEVEHALGNRDSTPAQEFDAYSDEVAVWPRKLEFTLSNRCNLACVQCNGDNSSTIRAKREARPPMPMPYQDGFFEQLPPFLEHLEVASFLGGEPFLAPEAKRVWDLLLECDPKPVVRVTTNATVWSEAIERYVYGLEMHLAVSIDGATKDTYEAIRVGADFERVIEIRDRMLEASRSYGGVFHLNYCLLRANWHEVGRFLLEADGLDVDANIIPVFGPSEHSVFTLPPDRLAPIVESLRAEDGGLRERLGRNRSTWDDVVRMLGDQLDRIESDASRETLLTGIRSRAVLQLDAAHRQAAARHEVAQNHAAEALAVARRRLSEPLAAAAEADLLAWAGQHGIEVSVESDVVTAVRAPVWAVPLQAEEWVGAGIELIASAVSARVGPVDYSDLTDISEGEGLVLVNDSVLTSSNGLHHFRTIYAPFLGRMTISTTDPLIPDRP